MKKPNVAILGATGAVGAEFITLIEERNFPYENLKLLASARSAGTELTVNGKTYVVEEAKPESFENIDIALFAGGSISKTLAPEAAKRGAIVIDNSSAFRMDPEVPLVVPEVNPEDIKINQLINRIKDEKIKEVILALTPNIEGETTSGYILKMLEGYDVSVTKIAAGIPVGADMEYLDPLTIQMAMQGRNKLS